MSDLQPKSSAESEETVTDDQAGQFMLNDVRIIPGVMVFENAYEGKRYRHSMIIQNCGSRLAFVRMSDPSSGMFLVKSFKDGIFLAPGMKISRTVRYTYSTAMGARQGFVTVWVNGEEAEYHFSVTLSTAVLSVEPQQLDFGTSDAANHAITRTFNIKNSGVKGSPFAIDLGRNPLDLLVDPLKGMIPAMSSVMITVEIIGSREGEFVEEIWIKTSPPLRVTITGEFIAPKLLVRKFINSLDFTLIEFQPTYYGSIAVQHLLIKNFSSSHSMFCVMAEIKGTTMTLDEAKKKDDNYKSFDVHPIDGRLAAHKGALIQITFKPYKSLVRNKIYAACFLKVIRMDCRDINQDDKLLVRLHPDPRSSTSDLISYASTTKELTIGTKTLSVLSLGQEEEQICEDSFSFEHTVGICVHGEKEIPNVSLRPTQIYLSELTLNRVYQRELLIRNNNSRLNIVIKYIKTPSIDVRPKQVDLKPLESVEVLVTIRTFKLDRIEKIIVFNLLAKNYPDRQKLRPVGKISLPVSYEATVLEKTTRIKQCVVCVDLSDQLEPEFPYRLSEAALTKKLQNNDYYLQYIRSLQKKPPKLLEEKLEYAITKPRRLKCPVSKPKLVNQESSYSPFIPLAPRLLYNIKIFPKSIKLRKVAANTTINDFLTIRNMNHFPIYVFITSAKSSIIFDISRHLIEGGETKKIFFAFSNYKIGRYYINIHILINDFAFYEVTAVAHVVPKTLKLDSNLVEFTEHDENYKFFSLHNALNAYTSFDWEVPAGCFDIYPRDGGIKAEKFILCMVTYHPDPAEANAAECCLTSESGQKRIVTLSYRKRHHSVVFDTYDIDFGVIPLNIPIVKKVTLKNLKNFQVLYSIINGLPLPGVTVEPQDGILDGLDSQVFTININLKAVINFVSEIIFLINDEEEICIGIKGVVDYPRFSFQPSTLYFRKISPFSVDTLAFKVSNLSKCESFVNFPAEDFPEFSITPFEDKHYPHLDKIALFPGQSKVLYLHFHPNHISTYSFYLPYIINDILGPVHVNSSRTNSPMYFLFEATQLHTNVQRTSIEPIPRSLPVIRINCNATEKTLEFINLSMNFLYFGEGHYGNVTSADFEIINLKEEEVEICIRVDELHYPFSLTPKEDENIDHYDLSYKLTIPPGEKFVFLAEFFPLDYGKFYVELPIFLQGYFDNKIFNFMRLNGVFGKPTIIPSTKRCDFEPIPIRLTNRICLTLRLYNHFEDCKVLIQTDLVGLSASFERDKGSTKEKVILNTTLSYEIRQRTCFCSEVTFECTCRTSCTIVVTGVTENCLLTTHVFSHLLKREAKVKSKSLIFSGNRYECPKYIDTLINRNTTCYPLFPKNDDTSSYATYMRDLQKTLEFWLFSQIFYKKCYYRIPEGFSDFCKVYEPPKKMIFGGYKKPKIGELPLLQLMMNIAGRTVRKTLAPSFPRKQDDRDWLIYTHKVNTSVLLYLSNFSVYIPHVEAKFLLNYQQYLQFEKFKRPKSKPFEESTFYRLSKQCWIDLILQIIKTFFLFRTVQPLFSEELIPELSASRFKNQYSFSTVSHSYSDEDGENILDIGVYGSHEKELMLWLQRCYDEERQDLWAVPPPEKDLIFLDEDLRDGLILGATIAHYCPYVRSQIRNLYTEPHHVEELLHNACVLIQTWQMLKFSYIISPQIFQTCGMVGMLLLVNYLYDVLPNYSPREEITIEAPLTQTNTTSIELENLGVDAITYTVVFFDNESELFYTSRKFIKVEPKYKKTVKVRYHAKCVQTVTATLLLSGETTGFKYGRSIVVTLKGVADVSYACMQIPLTVDLYQPCKVNFQTQSPFKVKTTYTLYFGYQHALKDRNVLFPWEEVKNLKTIKECYLQEAMCQFDEEGKSITQELICCQQKGPRDMWLYFTNPEVGDWGIQVSLTGRVTDSCFENIYVEIPDDYEQIACICKRKPSVTRNCPKIIFINLHKQNIHLWNARKAMVLHYVTGQELSFWSKRIYSSVGTRVLKLILNSETHPLKQTVQETVEYRVQTDRPISFVTLNKVVFDDITSEDFFALPIHPVKDLLQVKKQVMYLISADGQETRYYRLFFHKSDSLIQTTDII